MFAKTIAVTSGKGGVGKTYCSINLCQEFSRLGKRVLLIDCDFNLSNCAIALGVKTNKTFERQEIRLTQGLHEYQAFLIIQLAGKTLLVVYYRRRLTGSQDHKLNRCPNLGLM